MVGTQKLRLNEYLSTGCPYCIETLAKYTRKVKGIRGPVLSLPRDEALVVTPDYNSAGILTGFHIEVVKSSKIDMSV